MSSEAPVLLTPVDLSACEREPIHVPGRVQPHGVLLALRARSLTVAQVSRSAEVHLGHEAAALLDTPLERLLTPGSARALRTLVSSHPLETPAHLELAVGADGGARPFDALVHRSGPALVLELEPVTGSDPQARLAPYQQVREVLAQLRASGSLDALCRSAAGLVRRLTGFERVLVYRFDAVGHGEVVAEERPEEREAYLGLHYPASDIPRQARALYLRSWVRLIADAHAPPAELVPLLHPDTGQPLDLSLAVLRAVPPVHVEFLRNFGLRASMSLSLVVEGRLWGLITCSNHEQPRVVPYDVRAACEVVAQVMSQQLALLEEREAAHQRGRLRAVHERLHAQMSASTTLEEGLVRERPSVLDAVEASGAALLMGGRCTLLGKTPSEAEVRALAAWLQRDVREDVFQTHALALLHPMAEEYAALASGLLAVRLPRAEGEYLLWFRPEVVQTVTWGGDPRKPVEPGRQDGRLHPRASFAQWQQTLRLHARPWTPPEVEAAAQLRRAITEVDLKRQVLLERAARAEAEEAHRRFSVLSESIPEVVWTGDAEGRVDFYNSRWFEYTGLPREPQEEGSWMRIVHPDDLPLTRERWQASVASAHPFEVEHRLRDARGGYQWHLSRALPLHGPGGRLVRWFGTSTNVDALKRLEEERARAVRAREEVLAMVSHDLRTPLNTLQLATTLLQRELARTGSASEAALRHLDKVHRAAAHMNVLVRDVLDLGRIAAGALQVAPVAVEVEALLDDAHQLLAPLVADRGLTLQRHPAPPGLRARCDRERVLQVLSNLLGNAVKFTPAGGRVELGAQEGTEGEVQVWVRDNGQGIPAERLPRLFERYWQAPETAQLGTGLGLYIARGIVEAHGGRIWAESTPGVGSAFRFTLPRA